MELAINNSHRRWAMVGTGSGLLLLSMFYRVSNATIAPLLIEEFDLTSDQLGLLAASFFWTFAIFQIPLGFLLDRFGSKISMTTLSLIGGAGSIIFAQSRGMDGLLLGRGLLGIGMSCALMGNLKIFCDWFPVDSFATLSGAILSFATLGSMLATSPLVLMVDAIGWRGAFWLIGVINIIIGLTFFAVAKDKPSADDTSRYLRNENKPEIAMLLGLKRLFLNANFWTISWSAFFRYGTYAAIQALWAGPFLIDVLNISLLTAGNLILLLNVGFVVGLPIAGFLSDRKLRSRKKVIMGGLVLLCLCELALAFSRNTNLLWWGAIFLLMGMGSSCGQIMYSHIKELMPLDMVGRSITGVNFFSMLGPGVFLYGFGKILFSLGAFASEDQGYKVGFAFCSIAVIIALGLYTTTKDSIFDKS